MRVRDIPEPSLCFFYDRKGNGIPTDVVLKCFMDWRICAAPSEIEIRIVADEQTTKNFWNDLKGTVCKGNHCELRDEDSIAWAMNLTLPMARAWMWSCAEYGLTQREYPYGYNGSEPMWVIE